MAALSFLDRVEETTTTTGTGTLTLAGAATGFQAFSVLGNGARCRFCTTDSTNWEIAEGIWSTGGTLTRTLIASNTGALISWAAGSKTVFLVADASFLSGVPSITASTTAPVNPRTNDLWFKTDEGSLKIYYNDGDSLQWIDLMAGQPLTGGMVRIGKVVCVGGETTITFDTIPQGFSDLLVVITGRETTGADVGTRLQVNGDATSGNYTTAQTLQGNNVSVAAAQPAATSAGPYVGNLPGVTGDATAVGHIEILVPNYAGTILYKPFRGQGTNKYSATSQENISYGAVWKSTAAITKLVLSATAAYAAGTTATLYGMG